MNRQNPPRQELPRQNLPRQELPRQELPRQELPRQRHPKQAIPEVDVDEALDRFEAGDALFVDIRDPQSFVDGRIPGAIRVGDHNLREFVNKTARDQPIVVCCYHGNQSRGATGFFLEQGFDDVASLAGGFTEWVMEGPVETG